MVSISVVMPTYNTPTAILKEAVDSILSQTFQDFEFIIIDDGSTDDSCLYLQSIHDERIRLIRNQENLGIVKSLNIGLGTMIISGGLAGEHGVPRVNNPMEVSVVKVE